MQIPYSVNRQHPANHVSRRKHESLPTQGTDHEAGPEMNQAAVKSRREDRKYDLLEQDLLFVGHRPHCLCRAH